MALEQHPYRRVFTAAVGLAGEPVGDDWSAFDRERIFFAERSTQLSRGDHLFTIGAARKRAVLGLFEVASAGTEPIPSPEDPQRWPYSVEVRPLAGISPPSAISVAGVRTPRGLPQRIRDEEQQAGLYAAVEGGEGEPPELDLSPGSHYTWEQLGERFEFQPNYVSVAGGMISRPALNTLLLITHAGGARANQYGDYWDGDYLVYTGRGKSGDQKRDGQNRDLGENAKVVLVFEPGAGRELEFLGRAHCVNEWTERDRGEDGQQRNVLRFQLSFEETAPKAKSRATRQSDPADISRRPRKFDPSPAPSPPSAPSSNPNPEGTHALHEKAVQGHHDLLVVLHQWLHGAGWQGIEEIPQAVDLWATPPDGSGRVIFEAKTISAGSEGARVRSAIAQLLEYRFFHGSPADRLCLVGDQPIGERRVRLLDGLDIAVLWWDGKTFQAGSGSSSALLI